MWIREKKQEKEGAQGGSESLRCVVLGLKNGEEWGGSERTHLR
jgi:hypothetical protein